MSFLSIDPGKSGGFAWYDKDKIVNCCAMPSEDIEIINKLRELRASGIGFVIMESQSFYIDPTKTNMSSAHVGTFLEGYGFLKGAVLALGFSLNLVAPRTWQNGLSLGIKKTKGEHSAWKRALKEKACQLFPDADVTLKTCDALLLLCYGSQDMLMGQPKGAQ